MKKRLTLQDIAKLTGTSKSTVSRVMTGKGYVDEAVREMILKVVQEQGYRPQQSHKNRNVKDMVMVIACQLSSESQVTLANAIRSYLERFNKKTAIVSLDFGSDRIYEYMQYAMERDFGGIITLGVLETEELRRTMRKLTCPTVLLNQSIEGLNAGKVEMADYEGAYFATEYLLAKGHKKIVFLNGYENAVAIADRERGFLDAMADHGFYMEEIPVIYKSFDQASGKEFGDEMAAAGFPYTAVLTANDMLGIGLLQRLKQLQIKVPEQVSILGFGDTLLTQACSPALTVMGYDFEAMGEALASLLLEHMEKPFMRAKTICFKPVMIERQSVAEKTNP